MPYRLIQKGNKGYVINVDTKKKYSKNPIPISNAKKQLTLLEMLKKN